MHKAEARNRALDLATGDWVVVLDCDERIADPLGLRAYLEQTDAEAVYIQLAYMDANDRPTLTYSQMRIWRRGAYRYQYRAHEVPVAQGKQGRMAYTDFVWEHRPPADRAWKLDYTLDRLLLDVQENPGDPRPMYYLGRQYRYRQEWDRAIRWLELYLENPGIDKADAYYDLALCYAGQGDQEQQVKALYQAAACDPERRVWWGELAEVYHANGQDALAVGLLRCALELPMRERGYHWRKWYGSHIHDLLARCLWKLGRYEEGQQHAQQAAGMVPESQRLQDNLAFFDRKLEAVEL